MKISIYDNMLLNQQCISIKTNLAFVTYFKQLGCDDIKIHAVNVYLFNIPLAGEFTQLNSKHKRFIFEKEVGLYEEQYDLKVNYSDDLFQSFFEITWHGVVYHGEINSL